jgi:hypothetical protein
MGHLMKHSLEIALPSNKQKVHIVLVSSGSASPEVAGSNLHSQVSFLSFFNCSVARPMNLRPRCEIKKLGPTLTKTLLTRRHDEGHASSKLILQAYRHIDDQRFK